MKHLLLLFLIFSIFQQEARAQLYTNDWGMNHYNKVVDIRAYLDSQRVSYGADLSLIGYVYLNDSFAFEYDKMGRMNKVLNFTYYENDSTCEGVYSFQYDSLSNLSSITYTTLKPKYYNFHYQLSYNEQRQLKEVLATRYNETKLDTVNLYQYNYSNTQNREHCQYWVNGKWRNSWQKYTDFDSITGRKTLEGWQGLSYQGELTNLSSYPITYVYDEFGNVVQQCEHYNNAGSPPIMCYDHHYTNGKLTSVTSHQFNDGRNTFAYRHKYNYDRHQGKLLKVVSSTKLGSHPWIAYEVTTYEYYPNGLLKEVISRDRFPKRLSTWNELYRKRYYYNRTDSK